MYVPCTRADGNAADGSADANASRATKPRHATIHTKFRESFALLRLISLDLSHADSHSRSGSQGYISIVQNLVVLAKAAAPMSSLAFSRVASLLGSSCRRDVGSRLSVRARG